MNDFFNVETYTVYNKNNHDNKESINIITE